ncbi:hypothetical protein ACFVH6_32805 [Spirillospora sp. NPDC127200]
MTSKYPGHCRHCWQHVPAGGGDATHGGRAGEVQHSGACPPNPHDNGSPTITLTRRQSRGGGAWKPGQIVREYWAPHANPDRIAFPGPRTGDSFESGIVVVIAVRMSPGVKGDQDHEYSARLRPATDAEAAPLLTAEQTRQRRADLDSRAEHVLFLSTAPLCENDRSDTVQPTRQEMAAVDLDSLVAVPLCPGDPHSSTSGPPHPPRAYLDEPGGVVWTVVHNDLGDDHRFLNNIAGWIATRHPLTPTRRAVIEELFAEYGEHPESAAPQE